MFDLLFLWCFGWILLLLLLTEHHLSIITDCLHREHLHSLPDVRIKDLCLSPQVLTPDEVPGGGGSGWLPPAG